MVVKSSSFVNFIYPFLFKTASFEERVLRIENAKWAGKGKTLKIWERESLSGEDVLPHVAKYLSPPANVASPTAILWEMTTLALGAYDGLGANAQWKLITPYKEISFKMNNVRLALFHVGVGFVTTKVIGDSDDLNEWLDLLHYFRFTKGQRKVRIEAQRRISKSEVVSYFPRPSMEEMIPHSHAGGMFQVLMKAVLDSAAIKGDGDQWWKDVFVAGQLLPFASLVVDDVPNEQIRPLLFRIRNFYHSRQEIHPHENQLREDHPSLLPYAENQWFTFSLDGGGFVAFNPPKTKFFLETMATHLNQQYFLLFLLALEQRFELMGLSEMVSDNWMGKNEALRVATFVRIRNALLEFAARGYSSQVMQEENHHRCYQMLQRVFQVEHLYQEVKDEVNEMHDTLMMNQTKKLQQMADEQRKRTESFERLVSRLAFLLGLPVLAMSYLSVAYVMGWYVPSYWILGSIGIGVLLLWMLNLFRRKAYEVDTDSRVIEDGDWQTHIE